MTLACVGRTSQFRMLPHVNSFCNNHLAAAPRSFRAHESTPHTGHGATQPDMCGHPGPEAPVRMLELDWYSTTHMSSCVRKALASFPGLVPSTSIRRLRVVA